MSLTAERSFLKYFSLKKISEESPAGCQTQTKKLLRARALVKASASQVQMAGWIKCCAQAPPHAGFESARILPGFPFYILYRSFQRRRAVKI